MRITYVLRIALVCCLMSLLVIQVAQAQAADPLTGTWSGAFQSRHRSVSPFNMTIVITPNAKGHLIGGASLNSSCLSEAQLQVTRNGSNVTLAGHDKEGDNLTVHGTLDSTGTILTVTYILNASASGKCETDDGTGNLGKR